MRSITLYAFAFVLLNVILPCHEAGAFFLTSLALLPLTSIIGLGGLAGLKLAIAMKLLGHLGWWNVSRYGVGLRTSIENDKLPEPLGPMPPKPHGLFHGRTIKIPIALLPYFFGGHFKSPGSFTLPAKDFSLLARQSFHLDGHKLKLSSQGAAGVNGAKGSFVQAHGNMESPLVNIDARKKATLKGKRSAESTFKVIDDAFSMVREMDVDRCILRLSCEVSADPQGYGKYGRRVASFADSMGPVGNKSAFAEFQTAYRQGKAYGIAGCRRAYSTCKHDLRGLASLIGEA
ncbi:hypothetical protein HPB47_018079 [Ixodes persulcatus]|uniref:Uncharacterized protein n=1 Tax=Ixodes persulcatus TaxID=34615 RepID=A0AC60QLM0_IXOPE|nr:hypothetical protein HPB47_018079 [Ixodes persulcatus]